MAAGGSKGGGRWADGREVAGLRRAAGGSSARFFYVISFFFLEFVFHWICDVFLLEFVIFF